MMPRAALQLEPREKRLVIGGAVIATLVLGYLLWPSGSGQSAVELVPADQRSAPAPAAAAPQPLPVVQAGPPAAAPAPAAPAGVAEGLVLHGVMAGGAVIGFPDGSQRYVPVGRELMPGLRLQAVQLREAILASGSVNYRLGFGGPAMPLTPAPQVVGAPAAPAVPPPIVSAPAPSRQSAQRIEAGRYRQALSPRLVDGRVSGYTFRPGIGIQALEQAGLQPGDTILSVNGAPISQSHVEQLARLPAGNTAELMVERGDQRVRLVVQGR
jgi:membrane-associated protease RseP (regulator of RpoE activity)